MPSNNTRRVYLLDAPLCRIWFRLSYDYFLSFFYDSSFETIFLSLSLADRATILLIPFLSIFFRLGLFIQSNF